MQHEISHQGPHREPGQPGFNGSDGSDAISVFQAPGPHSSDAERRHRDGPQWANPGQSPAHTGLITAQPSIPENILHRIIDALVSQAAIGYCK